MLKRKKGEQKAITILENLGIEIDRNYHDDNSQQSMPDIRCINGRYIEVTHTLHNNSIPTMEAYNVMCIHSSRVLIP